MNKRIKKHPEYYCIRAYQILALKSNSDMAKALGIKESTYAQKVKGWLDFTSLEAQKVSELLNREQSEIFLLKNVSNRNKLSKPRSSA